MSRDGDGRGRGRRGNVPPAVSTKRVAVYSRQSVARADGPDFTSCDAQREACEAYVAAQPGWTMVRQRYEDSNFSGGTLDRPAFRRLLEDIDAGRVDIVVVYKIDRFSRSLLDFARVMDGMAKAGCDLVSVTQNFSTADSMGRLTLNMLMSFAQFEREMISERTRDKIAASRRKGLWTGGTEPLGYDGVDKRLVVNEAEAAVIREVFELYLGHKSALTVAKLLNQRGRRTKVRHFSTGRVCGGFRWDKVKVLRVLQNPLYAGWMEYGGERFEGEHAGIVDRDTFERAQAILEGRVQQAAPTTRNAEYLLRGLLRCGCCGYAYTTASTKKGDKSYRYYRCVTRFKNGEDACPGAALPAAEIESFVAERLRHVVEEPGLADEVLARMQAKLAAQRQALKDERKKLSEDIARWCAQVGRLAAGLPDANVRAREALNEQIREIGEHRDVDEHRLHDVEGRLAGLDQIEVDAAWVTEALKDFDAIWGAMTPENRGRLVRALVRRVVVDDTAGTVRIELAGLSDDGEMDDLDREDERDEAGIDDTEEAA